MIVLWFSIQGEDIIEHANGKCCVYTVSLCEKVIFFSILMPSVVCVYFNHLVDHCVT